MKTRLPHLFISVTGAIILLHASWLLVHQSTRLARAQADILYVAPQGDCGVAAPCFANPQEAVLAATPGDEIRVAAGVYNQKFDFKAPTGYLGEEMITQVLYITKPLTITGGFTKADWNASKPDENPTILDAQGKCRVVLIANAKNITLHGLQITGGSTNDFSSNYYLYEEMGGGVFVISATLTISATTIHHNGAINVYRSSYQGGGVYAAQSKLAFMNTLIFQNATDLEGGGIFAVSTQLYLKDSQITYNRTWGIGGEGGGIYISEGELTLQNNLIEYNIAHEKAAGLLANNSIVTVDNSTIRNHSSNIGAGMTLYDSQSQILSSTIQNNSVFLRYGGGDGAGIFIFGGSTDIIANDINGNLSCMDQSVSKYDHESACSGGGIWIENGNVLFERNRIVGNISLKGGALATFGETIIKANNNVFLGNQADHGSSLYLGGEYSKFIHNTFSQNPGPNSNIEISSGSTAVLKNSIISGHEIGVLAMENSTTTLRSVLWFMNTTNITGTGEIEVMKKYAGNPAFACDGYHLSEYSAAIDRGIETQIHHDYDRDPRPLGGSPDLGADEFGGYVLNCQNTYLPFIFR